VALFHRYVVTSMANSMILWSCSELVVMFLTPTIFSWVRVLRA
jgi:hypothetical protein